MTSRENISSGSSYEETYGYSRATQVGDKVYISGTIGFNYETGSYSDGPKGLLRQILRNMELALAKAGATLTDFVQIKTYVTSAQVFAEIGPVLDENFGNIRPTNAAHVVWFPVPNVKVEIAAVAVVGCGA